MSMMIKATEAECRDGMAKAELAFMAKATQLRAVGADDGVTGNVRQASFKAQPESPQAIHSPTFQQSYAGARG